MTSPRCSAKPGGARDSSDLVAGSAFEEFRKGESGRFLALEAIERLLQTTRARHIILSYSSGGRATAGELNEVIPAARAIDRSGRNGLPQNVMAAMALDPRMGEPSRGAQQRISVFDQEENDCHYREELPA